VLNLPSNAVGKVVTNFKSETNGGSSSSENMAGTGRGEDEIMV